LYGAQTQRAVELPHQPRFPREFIHYMGLINSRRPAPTWIQLLDKQVGAAIAAAAE
jgi:hypothetical protein